MSYKVAICDDNDIDRAYVKQLFGKWCDDRQIFAHVDTFSSAEQFLFNYADHKDYDILLLDIEMVNMDGVTLARQIRQDNATVEIVFITGYADYIAEGYDVSALHYLMKPLSEQKFFAVLNRAVNKLLQNERTLNLTEYGEMVRIPLHEIKYLDVKQNYVTVHANAEHTVKRTLGEFESLLDDRFLRVGRAIIVNLTYVTRVTKQDIYLKDGTMLPLPRDAYELINKAIISKM